ncbi:hypothetical protein KUTeg_022216 [Tegillarca granosa]|uniref:C2H2-type domain-containing protein n=1 Tax=Tegillarca granosa TaxID=220873 RepID=A0ABQ9E5Y5_TEGGR|nr:hypothetical protein KUTeg_022216 [Tegillarca granosa]
MYQGNVNIDVPAITRDIPCHPRQGIRKENHSTATHSSNVQTRTFRCHKCSSSFPNRRRLYLHDRQEHSQVGEGLRSYPWGQNSAPWEKQDGSTDEELKTVYNANSSLILAQHDLGPVRSIYNFPIDNTVSLNRLIRFASEIYDQEDRSFRLNMSFGMILQNRRTGEYRYYIPYVNSNVFESPMFISKRSDLRRLNLQLRKWDILTELLRNRPNTEWIPVLMTNVHFAITSTNYVLGKGCLPNYILKRKSIIALDKCYGKPYNDNLCLFRCLALHRGYDPKSLENASKDYYQQWKRDKETTEPFQGVTMRELPEFESLFEVNVEVFSLSEDEFVTPIYKSRGRYQTSLYVNLYENHLSYIKDFKQYAKKVQCNLCLRHFGHYGTFKRHRKTCDNKTKYIYPGKFYRMPLTIFEKLQQFNIHVPEEHRVFPWFICYDFESMFETVDDHPTDSLEWVYKHVPISVSICSNVPDYQDCKCIIETDQDTLVKDMLQYMLTIATKVEELAEERWGWVIKAIKKKLKRNDFGSKAYLSTVSDEEDEGRDEEKEEENVKEDDPRKQLKRLYGQMKGYLLQVPVLGFNSAKYDLNLIKQRIAKHLNLHMTEDKDGNFVFLSPGSSYTSFLKAYDVEERKCYFPYEWLDDVTKLDSTELPPHDAFYSQLKQKNISQEEYDFCQQVWNDNNMKTFRDFLKWYNNLDVGPFVIAVERLQKFYFDQTIDLFKTAISVPEGITILHEHNTGSEVRVGRYPVDGFQMNETAVKKPLTRHVTDKKWHDNKETKYKKTQEITAYLKDKGCIVIEKWECEFREYCKKHLEIYQFINSRRPGHIAERLRKKHILKAVRDNELFGLIEVDIEVPPNWSDSFTHPTMSPYEYFREMSPLFCNTEIPFEAIGSHMQDHVLKHGLSKGSRRLLIGGMKAKQILLATPLLQWYLNHGMVVTKIYQLVEFQQKRCFSNFVQKVSNARREGDKNQDTAIIADTMKVIGNSAYGSMIMDKHKHRDIIYVQGENETCLKAYDKFHWFPRRCCAKHAKFDKRTPGLFKLEYRGDEIIGLCSKTYIVRQTKVVKPSSTRLTAYKLLRKAKRLKSRKLTIKPRIRNEYKFSSKGVSKRNVKTPMYTFKRVLKTGLSKSSTNRGFRTRNNTIDTYTQNRRGFGYFYCKRVVGDDGCTTSPLDITLCPIPPDQEEDDDEINDFNLVDICLGLLVGSGWREGNAA